MTLFNNLRRMIRPIHHLARTESTYSYKQAKIFKKIDRFGSNAFPPNQKQPSSFSTRNQKSYERSAPLERLCVYRRSALDTAMRQLIEKRVSNAYTTPILQHPGYQAIQKKPIGSFIGQWGWYAETKEPGRPAPSKASETKTSGVKPDDGKVHPYPLTNLSTLEEIKRMLREKAIQRQKDNAGKKD